MIVGVMIRRRQKAQGDPAHHRARANRNVEQH